MNSNLFNEDLITKLKNGLVKDPKSQRTCIKDNLSNIGLDNVKIEKDPFLHGTVIEFIQDAELLERLVSELVDLKYTQKDNDLYKFQQSVSLHNMKKCPAVALLRDLMVNQCRDWLTQITGVSLTSTVDMTASKYEYTDTLLCHDDELEGRRFAYILYLVPEDWNAEDGGTLDLFSTTAHNQPLSIMKSLVPVRNSLVFFEVSPASFHQVSEILSESKSRLSVNGWFHGPTVPRAPAYIEPRPDRLTPVDMEKTEFLEYVNPLYLDEDSQKDLSSTFEETSEMELASFLEIELYSQLLEEICENGKVWKPVGPPNQRSYAVLDVDMSSPFLDLCTRLFRSQHMFSLLGTLTGLNLAPKSITGLTPAPKLLDESEPTPAKMAKLNSKNGECNSGDTPCSSGSSTHVSENTTNGEPKCHMEVRRWSHGSYTLMHDRFTEHEDEFTLDAHFFLNCPDDLLEEAGGCVHYVAKDEEDTLLMVEPMDNTLALVYRDKETMGFVKHINDLFSKNGNTCFYSISVTYYE